MEKQTLLFSDISCYGNPGFSFTVGNPATAGQVKLHKFFAFKAVGAMTIIKIIAHTARKSIASSKLGLFNSQNVFTRNSVLLDSYGRGLKSRLGCAILNRIHFYARST